MIKEIDDHCTRQYAFYKGVFLYSLDKHLRVRWTKNVSNMITPSVKNGIADVIKPHLAYNILTNQFQVFLISHQYIVFQYNQNLYYNEVLSSNSMKYCLKY